MNKRQAKKEFKKKYGINPKTAKNILYANTNAFVVKLAAAMTKSFGIMTQLAKEYNERIIEIGFDAMKKELEEKMAQLKEEKS